MDVVAYLRILRRHWRMIVVAAVLGALIGVATTLFDTGNESSASNGRRRADRCGIGPFSWTSMP